MSASARDVVPVVMKLVSPARLIDVGCGEAWIARALRQATVDFEYVGVDFNDPMVEALRKRKRPYDIIAISRSGTR